MRAPESPDNRIPLLSCGLLVNHFSHRDSMSPRQIHCTNNLISPGHHFIGIRSMIDASTEEMKGNEIPEITSAQWIDAVDYLYFICLTHLPK